MKKYIVRFKGTPPNHYDAPRPRLLEATDKDAAREKAVILAALEGLEVNSVRTYFGTHELATPNDGTERRRAAEDKA